MSKVNYDDWINEDPFHPCLKCSGEEFQLNLKTDLYTCVNCGEAMIAPKEPIRKKKAPRKKVRLSDDDWE